MFALAIEYLTGRSVSTRHDDRDAAEWPPHPFRVFAALVATLKATGDDPTQHEALEWLERQGAPSMSASRESCRNVTTHFVPINDTKLPRNIDSDKSVSDALNLLPERRGRKGRQRRTFPSVTPVVPTVCLVWRQAEPCPRHGAALAMLSSMVTWVGHSSSLISMSLCRNPPESNLVPDDAGRIVMRVPFPGQLKTLEREYDVHQGVRQRTLTTATQRYRETIAHGAPATASSVFGDDWIVFRHKTGARLTASATLKLTEAFRKSSMAHCEEPIPEALSGHKPNGERSDVPHVAFVALSDVGHRHAGGGLMGIAAVLPRDLVGVTRRIVLRAVGRAGEHPVTLGKVGVWEIERITVETCPHGLRPETWTGPARQWATVTPVVFDRFPDEPDGEGTRRIIADSCERIGLPYPEAISVMPMSVFAGVPPASEFPPQPARPGKPQRWHSHAVITFPDDIVGPVLIGAGRYRGYGLCRPVGKYGREP